MPNLMARIDRLRSRIPQPVVNPGPDAARIRAAVDELAGRIAAYVTGESLERCLSPLYTTRPGEAEGREALAKRIDEGTTTPADETFLLSLPANILGTLGLSAAGYVCLVAGICDDEHRLWTAGDGARMDRAMPRIRAIERRREGA